MERVTATSSSSSTHLIHNLLLRHPKAPSSVCLFLRPFCFSASISQSNLRSKPRLLSKPLPSPCTSFVVKSFSSIDEPDLEEDEESEDEDYSAEEYEYEDEEEDDELDSGVVVAVRGIEDSEASEMGLGDKEEKTEKAKKKSRGSALKLSIKEKKELASYAHSLGDKLKCQLVGKSGVTDSVVFSFLETLEKNELLKVKIRKTSPDELEDAVQHLEEATGSVAVGQIGRTVILYRPSPTKMKAEAKKKEVERMSITRRQKYANTRPTKPFRREYSERPDGRGRRGGSRVPTA
ncbi:RNA-binding CRM domain [Arabidopsis thaliana x Arabidopsis arenosa]|uniref:RNA-binding CRM domain n=1 Tax=Arabidopsis thaliana x Arabidopsis arenosa TaxID=1240361 RepID=A0A8T1XXK3_9BRAS|nr:RNA-binding CRM domain [Arabidopsis thaliana x Arabidopsis arenosa]